MRHRRILIGVSVAVAAAAAAVIPLTEAAAATAPTAIAARSFSLTTDMTSLADELAALNSAMSGRLRSVGQVMEQANRERTALCNSSVYAPLTSRSGTGVTGYCWNDGDDAVDYWIPQGLTTTHDALDAGEYDGHQLVVASWYHAPENEGSGVPNKGVRLSFTDWDADWPNTYRHVLLAEPTAGGSYKAVQVHAGGIMWYGNLLYVADTWNGFRIFDVGRIYATDSSDSGAIGKQSDGSFQAYGYAYVMPQVGWVRNAGGSLRYSFVALDRATSPDSFVVGEYSTDDDGNGVPDSNARVVRFPLDYTDRLPREESDGRTYGSEAYDTHIPQMQGAVARDGKFRFASSRGASTGYLRVWDRGTASVRTYSWAIGPEDLSYWADPDSADLLWTLTERTNQRIVVAVPQADWD